MKSMMKKTTVREIRKSLGRYIAILAIIALGVGFFSGLKVTKTAMVDTTNEYIKEYNLFDYRMISTYGLTQEDVASFAGMEGVEYAVGSYNADALIDDGGENAYVAKLHSFSDKVNGASLEHGRYPENKNECLVDARMYSEDDLGKTIRLASENTEETLAQFNTGEFEIVGTVYSSYYLNFERGSTALGNGNISGFIYIMPEAFEQEFYHEIFVTLKEKEFIYSEAYDELIKENLPRMEAMLTDLAEQRYLSISSLLPYELAKPETYVLGRNTNVGYVSFENDSNIVEGIANVFPIFFFLVAALVCVTTMNRMVEEQRTQIGVLKALGYSSSTIMGKYMFYSGSAAMVGCVSGFFAGCYAFPAIIWLVYDIMYGFTDIYFIFDLKLFVIAIVASLLCSIGTTWISCRRELNSMAAELIRPKTPKAGKRILLERVPFIWKRLKFLHKVSIRNVMRYKKRFFMMILGISGCSALLVAGFGLKDSIANIAGQQYDEIQIYDMSVNFAESQTDELQAAFTKDKDMLQDVLFVAQGSYDFEWKDYIKAITLIIPKEPEKIESFIDLHDADGRKIAFPQYGEVVITENIADKYDVVIGDTITIRDSDRKAMEVRVSGICENFFMTYVYMHPDTYETIMEKSPVYKTAYANIKENTDIHKAAVDVMNTEGITSATLSEDTKENFAKMMESLNYIVLLIIVCAGALAFIVLYNLTNINITERIREIATIKVLGFYPGETASYVFRENLVLTAIGALAGLILGYFLHGYVMYNIKIDLVNFDVHIKGFSYLLSVILTFGFAVFIDIVMYFKLKKINMAESLKSIE